MKKISAEELYKKYQLGTCTPEERNLIEHWYIKEIDNKQDREFFVDYEGVKSEIWSSLEKQTLPKQTRISNYIPYAAAILLCMFGLLFWFYRPQHDKLEQLAAVYDKIPGNNAAFLTLGDGRKIELSGTKTALVVSNSVLSYSDGSSLGIAAPSLNAGKNLIANTPRGGTYQLELPDGTKVWLNAESALSFPATFAGMPVRKVQLVGEAYFEVSKQRGRPFIVNSGHQEIEVLGTHFNVSAYPDEQLKTTLLEGRVKVSARTAPAKSLILDPGDQSVLSGGNLRAQSVDTDYVMAWKNGEFMFNNESLELIMDQIGRWYDMKVVYEDPEIKTALFSGGVTRFGKVSRVLLMLQRTGHVSFELKQNTIVVKK